MTQLVKQLSGLKKSENQLVDDIRGESLGESRKQVGESRGGHQRLAETTSKEHPAGDLKESLHGDNPVDDTSPNQLKHRIASMKKNEEDLREEREYAEKLLRDSIKSGASKDLAAARSMMSDVQRKTALATLSSMGYTCDRKPESTSNITSGFMPQGAQAQNGTKDSPAPSESLVLLEEEADPAAPNIHSVIQKAFAATDKMSSMFEKFRVKIADMQDGIQKTHAAVGKLKNRAASRAKTVTVEAHKKVKDMEALVKSMRKEQAVLKKLFGRKKITEAQTFLSMSKEKHTKAIENVKLFRQDEKKLQKKEKAKSASVTWARETVNNAEVEELNSGMKMDKAVSESIFDGEIADINSARFGKGAKPAQTPKAEAAKPEAEQGFKGVIKAQEQDEVKSEEEQVAKDNEKIQKAKDQVEATSSMVGNDKSKADIVLAEQKRLDKDIAANENALKKALDARAQSKRDIEQAETELKEAKEENTHMFRQKFGTPPEQKGNTKVSSPGPISAPQVSAVSATKVKQEVKSDGAESAEDAEVQMAKEEVKRDDQESGQGGVTMEQVVRALKGVVDSGSHAGLQKAEELLAKLDPTFKPSIPPTPKDSQKRKDTYANEKLNFAKCQGKEHGSEGGTGKIKCTPSEGTCPDTAGGKGVFILTAAGGSGFCAPWYNKMQNTSSLEFEYKSLDQGDSVLGDTFITKMTVTHPDTADRRVGLLAFKRTVCKNHECYEYKVGRCIKCDMEMFKSIIQKENDDADTKKFLQSCALPLLKKETFPKQNECTGPDKIKASRFLLGL